MLFNIFGLCVCHHCSQPLFSPPTLSAWLRRTHLDADAALVATLASHQLEFEALPSLCAAPSSTDAVADKPTASAAAVAACAAYPALLGECARIAVASGGALVLIEGELRHRSCFLFLFFFLSFL